MARKDAELCAEFREYVEVWRKYFRKNIQQYHDMHRFVFGSQWEDDEEQLLKDYNKVPLTANKIAPLANYVIGEQMRNTPNLEAAPDSDDIDQQTAAVRQALVKSISLDSKARTIYNQCYQQAVVGGFSAYWISHDYINNRSFDQSPLIQGFQDATRCFWDVGAQTTCKTDGMQCGFYARMSRKLFRKTYGKRIESTIPATVTETEEDTNASFQWNDADVITIGQCFKRSLIKGKLYQLSNGEKVTDEEFDQLETISIPNELEDGKMNDYLIHNGEMVTIVNERDIMSYKIKHYKWAGDYILEETDCPSQQLPVVFVDQNSYWDKQGVQICRPMFKDVRDTQKFINYLITQIAYLIKVSRYDQFMASRANVKSPKTQLIWKNPTVQQGALIYDVDKEGGTKPERLQPPELPVTLIQQYERALMDMQTSTGIYNTQIGDHSNEISGSAIEKRKKGGSITNSVSREKLDLAIAVGGEIINEMIPVLFDSEREVTLEMPDVGKQPVVLNQQADIYGTTVLNDMTRGEFKVRLVPGASYEGQKEEALASMQLVLQSNPELFNLIADLYVENLPVPNSIELRNRLRTIVPPEIIEAGKTGKPVEKKEQAPPPEIMLKLKELALKEKKLEADIAKMQHEAEQDDVETQLAIQKMELERVQTATELQEQILRYQAERERTAVDAHVAHAQNIVELLTRPNKFNQHEPKSKTA